jgi:hypothetical protein
MADTASPLRNFSLSLQERIRALMGGPPAWIRRRRRIEDLEAEIVELITRKRDGFDPAAPPRAVATRYAELCELVDRNNRYSPIEARLPMDPRTGELLDRGRPWKAMEPVSMQQLVERADAAKKEL